VNSVREFGRDYVDGPTEIIQDGSSELWEIVNLTGDTHPIHFHLVNFEVLARQPFEPESYKGGAFIIDLSPAERSASSRPVADIRQRIETSCGPG
jgi:FtsP/CotA-like multicopper oxidase with cupredoxin domain